MNPGTASRLARLRNLSLTARMALLGCIALVILVVASPIAWGLTGRDGLLAASSAAGICFVGAALALVVAHLLRAPKMALYGLLFAMGLRMGIPLSFAMIVHLAGGQLADAGVLYYLAAFYPITLGVETALSLPDFSATGPFATESSAKKSHSPENGC